MNIRKVSVALALGLTLVWGSGCQGGGTDLGGSGSTSEAAKKVASIDEAAIYGMDEFKKADETLKKWDEKERTAAYSKVKDKSPQEKEVAFQTYQLEFNKKQNELLNPLKEKARAAIALAAQAKGYTVVLDKKIVVYGVPDITEDVKATLSKGDKLEYPKEDVDPKQSPIGYFDQNVVRNLKAFKEAELALAQERAGQIQKIQAEFEKQGRKPTPSEMQQIQQTLEARLQALQEQKVGPLIKAVTDSVSDVAKQENLSLVLDTQHVMYGGRNLTEQVVDNFLKKIDNPTGAGSAASPTPKAAATPTPASEG